MSIQDAKNTTVSNINTVVGFRLNCRQFFLTYPKCTLSQQELLDLIPNKENIKNYYISQEKHQDGTPHLHAYIEYSTKKNIKDPKHFDIKGFHPNIQSVKNKKNVISYVCKYGNFIHNQKLDISNPINYLKRKKDFEAWQNDISQPKDITYPITIFDQIINKPDPSIKQRHLWVIGPPDWGKTYAIQKAFAGLKVFLRSDNSYPFEDYNNEDIIIYDDFKPTFEEIAAVTTTYLIKTTVYGNTRYQKKYWPINHTRTIIIISNHEPEYNNHQEAINKRFQLISLSTPLSGGCAASPCLTPTDAAPLAFGMGALSAQRLVDPLCGASPSSLELLDIADHEEKKITIRENNLKY